MTLNVDDLFQQKEFIDKLDIKPIESLERLKISRGYYANFSLAKLVVLDAQFEIQLVEINCQGRKFGSHEKIFESMIATKNKDLIEIAYKLKNYHILRKKSDYDLHLDITDIDIKNAETYFCECGDRMRYFIKYPNVPYTKSKKIITVDMTSDIPKVSGLKIID